MGKILLTISIFVVLGFNLVGVVPVFAQQDCYQTLAGETPLPTFGPTCAVEPSPQPTTPPQPTSTPQPTATPAPLPPTNPPPTALPKAGNIATTLLGVFIGFTLLLFGLSVASGFSPQLLQKR